MSTITQDDILYAKALDLIEPQSKKILQRELLYVIDNNGGPNYNRNQVEFETSSLSNNGKLVDYENGFITMPFVCTIDRTGTHLNDVTGPGSIILKSPLAMINSVTWSYNNDPVIPERNGIASLSNFKLLSEWSQDDVQLHGSTIGFHKSSDFWSYTTLAGVKTDPVSARAAAALNEYNASYGKSYVVPQAVARENGADSFEMVGDTAVYRKDLHIRLKDLPGFADFPVIRGGSLKVTLRLNQGVVVRTLVAPVAFVAPVGGVGGVLAVAAARTQVNTLRGSCVPILMTEPITNVEDYVETITWGIGEINGFTGTKQNCRLYLPSVIMSPEAELQYLAIGEKKHYYQDYQYLHIKARPGNSTFNENLTNGIKRAKALLVIPALPAAANGTTGVGSADSLTFAGPCCPYSISDYNVEISGSDLYSKPLQYRYEHFQHELGGGRLGNDAGMSAGTSSGLISKVAHDACHGYLYSDLSRRYGHDDNFSTSLSIRGQIRSPLALDLHCYILFEKDLTVDLATGAKVA